MLIILYLKISFYSCVLRCLSLSTATKITSENGVSVELENLQFCLLLRSRRRSEETSVFLSKAWAAAVMPRDPFWRLGQGTLHPKAFQKMMQPGSLCWKRKAGVQGPVLPWSIQVMPGLCEHLWWKCPSASKVQWLILTPRVDLGNLSLPLPFYSIPQRQGCCQMPRISVLLQFLGYVKNSPEEL